MTVWSDTLSAEETTAPLHQRLLAWLTLERLAYFALFALALTLRLAKLGQTPFSPAEAAQAVAALDALTQRAALPASGVSPLLLTGQWLLFLLAHPTEASARILPALLGAATVPLAYGLRHELGRLAALGTALLLTFSATLLFWSRQATGEALVILGSMALIVSLAGWRRGVAAAPWGVAAALAALLLAAPVAYSVLLAAVPLSLLAFLSVARPARARLMPALFGLLAALLLGATGFFFLPGGLAATADLPAVWLHGFTRSADPLGSLTLVATSTLPASLLTLLWLDPLIVAAGLGGLVAGLRRRHWLVQGLGLWLLLALLLLLVRGGRTTADLMVLATPLAVLSGLGLATFVRRFDLGEYRREGVTLLVAGLVVLLSTAVWLSEYTETAKGTPQPAFLISAAATLVILAALAAAYVVLFNRQLVVRVLLALALLVLALLELRGATLISLNNEPLRWNSLEPLTGAHDSYELTRSLARQAMLRQTDLRDLPVAFLTPPGNPVPALLRWVARDAVITSPNSDNPDLVLLGLADASTQQEPAPGLNYSGQSFRIAQRWSPDGLTTANWLRWLLYGYYGSVQNQQRAVLWVPAGPAPQSTP